MTRARKQTSDAQFGGWSLLGVLAIAIGVGVFALPRLGRRAARAAPALVGQPARDFALPVLSGPRAGQTQRLSDLRGRTVLLDFWASWCMPCREQAVIVERVAHTLSGPTLAVYGINTSDQRAAAERYLKEHPPSYPMLFDQDQQAADAFDVSGLPTLIVIDKDGVVRAAESGVLAEGELVGLIRDAGGG